MLPIEEISKAIGVLNQEGVILYPTDTVWGLGCRFDSQTAYDKLRSMKGREADKTFILLVSSIAQLKEYVTYIHPRIETLLVHHQRPLTLIYHQHQNIPSYCQAPDGSVAIRIAQDPMCQALLDDLGCPITSTSANFKGQPTPKHFGEIQSDIITSTDFVFDYKRAKSFSGTPSVIASFNEKGDLEFIRE